MNTMVTIHTTLGDITVQLADHEAPRTVANFLAYVRAEAYRGGAFWRTVVTEPDNQPHNDSKIDVIQATCHADFAKFEAIAMEGTQQTGLRHRHGTISMARFAPDSAQADFFICIGNQASLDAGGLRNPDGHGFAAFGQVQAGMDVVQHIQRQPQHEQRLTPAITITHISVETDAPNT
jgi:peptidyl-prolyl cis-trans isomerase A (cyclophilin A)